MTSATFVKNLASCVKFLYGVSPRLATHQISINVISFLSGWVSPSVKPPHSQVTGQL